MPTITITELEELASSLEEQADDLTPYKAGTVHALELTLAAELLRHLATGDLAIVTTGRIIRSAHLTGEDTSHDAAAGRIDALGWTPATGTLAHAALKALATSRPADVPGAWLDTGTLPVRRDVAVIFARTALEVAELLGRQRIDAARRISDLRRAGLVAPVGTMPADASPSATAQRLWTLTAAGWRHLHHLDTQEHPA